MSPSKIRVPDLKEKKSRGEKIAMLTAYDATMARLMDQAGVDAILVGDSVGMVVLGYENTLAVTLDDMLHHTRAVMRGAARALVVTDMPFLSYQVSVEEAVRNAGRLLQEGGASAVKLEGGRPVLDAVRRMVDVGIPVMGHLGLQPQSVNQVGGYLKQATRPQDADALIADALALQDAGAFAIVLESIPEEVAKAATAALEIAEVNRFGRDELEGGGAIRGEPGIAHESAASHRARSPRDPALGIHQVDLLGFLGGQGQSRAVRRPARHDGRDVQFIREAHEMGRGRVGRVDRPQVASPRVDDPAAQRLEDPE